MSFGLTNAELTQIRTDIETLLPDTGYILTISATSDGQGGFTEGTITAGTVSYRMDAQGGKEALSSDSLKPYSRYMLTLPYDTEIIVTQRFQSSNDNVYNVVEVNTDQSWIGCKRVIVEKI